MLLSGVIDRIGFQQSFDDPEIKWGRVALLDQVLVLAELLGCEMLGNEFPFRIRERGDFFDMLAEEGMHVSFLPCLASLRLLAGRCRLLRFSPWHYPWETMNPPQENMKNQAPYGTWNAMERYRKYLWYWPETAFGLTALIVVGQLGFTAVKFGPTNPGFFIVPLVQGILGFLFGLLGVWMQRKLLSFNITVGASYFMGVVAVTLLLTAVEIMHYRPKFDENDFRHMGFLTIGIGYAYARRVRIFL
jgi:hypothetical protein